MSALAILPEPVTESAAPVASDPLEQPLPAAPAFPQGQDVPLPSPKQKGVAESVLSVYTSSVKAPGVAVK